MESRVCKADNQPTSYCISSSAGDTQSKDIRLPIGCFKVPPHAWVPSQLSFLFFQRKKYPFSKLIKAILFYLQVTIQACNLTTSKSMEELKLLESLQGQEKKELLHQLKALFPPRNHFTVSDLAFHSIVNLSRSPSDIFVDAAK